MKIKKLLIPSALLVVAVVFCLSIAISPSKGIYKPREQNPYKGIKPAIEWLSKIRNNQITGILNPNDILAAFKQVKELDKYNSKALPLTWDELGPNNVGGRTRAILWDKRDATYNTIYAGGVSGGLWKSINRGSSWSRVVSLSDNLAISCISQGVDGAIYVGTGEGFTGDGSTNYYTTGLLGGGVFKSTSGDDFVVIASTVPTPHSTTVNFAYINDIECDPTIAGRVYLGTNNKFLMSNDGGTTWITPKLTNNIAVSGSARDIELGSDGSVVIYSSNKSSFYSSNGNDLTYSVMISSSVNSAVYSSGGDRTTFAIAPSDPNYIYALVAGTNEQFSGIFRSTDKGSTWTLLAPGGSTNFDVFESGGGHQGAYDNVIQVFPNNKNHIVFGGINMWEWYEGSQPMQISWSEIGNRYVHVDHHAYVFHPTNPNILAVGTDGGFSLSIDGCQSFHTLNKNFAVTQYYAVAFDNNGAVMGGTQDNSTPYVARTGSDPKKGEVLWGGDGGWASFSMINPNYMYFTSQNASCGRTNDRYTSQVQGAKDNLGNPAFFNVSLNNHIADTGASFVTPLVLWESFNDPLSKDSIMYIADTNHLSGSTIVVKSSNDAYPISYITQTTINKHDTVMVQDIVQSKYFLGTNNAVWMTKQAMRFASVPNWYKISRIPGVVQALAYSKDGNYLFAGTQDGRVFRVSNIQAGYDSLTLDIRSPACLVVTEQIASFSRSLTSISVDPNDVNRVIITLGNFGNTNYVYLSENALDATPTFATKQGNLPAMPVYGGIIEMHNGNIALVGTEYGVYATSNINASNPTWIYQNNGMEKVPVFMIRQQTMKHFSVFNSGCIYIGTHGRGIYEARDFYEAVGISENLSIVQNTNLTIYPNPATDYTNISFNLNQRTNTFIKVYDLSGKIIYSEDIGSLEKGKNIHKLQFGKLQKGTYIIKLDAGKNSSSGKFLVL